MAIIFVISFVTVAVPSFIFGDHNMYIVHADGSKRVKDHANFGDKVVGSVVLGGIYSFVNTLCVWGVEKVLRRRTDGGDD